MKTKGDVDSNITDNYYIYTTCYNCHLDIEEESKDDELRELMTNRDHHLPPLEVEEQYSHSILEGVKRAVTRYSQDTSPDLLSQSLWFSCNML